MKEVGSCQEFLQKYRRRIMLAALRALWVMRCTDPKSHWEDVSSDVAKKVLAHWDHLVTPENALSKIIVHAACDHIRECLAEVAQEIHDSAAPCFVQAGQDPEEMLFDALLLKELLSLLNHTEKNVIHLAFCGYSSTDIGKFLNLPAGTVRAIKSRAIEKMRRIALTLRDGESAI